MSIIQENSNIQDEVLQWVTFGLAHEVYGINVLNVKEVQRYSEISPIPGAPSYVIGILNLRGNVITVIDTRKKFALPADEVTDESRIIILEVENQEIGLLVDNVSEVVYIKNSEVDDTPQVGNEESARFIQGVCNKNNSLLILLDSGKILNDEELQELQSVGG